MELRRFQRAFIRGATAPGIDTAALSTPRGQGKSWLAAHLLARVLTPSDDLFRPGTESVLCAGTLEQARIVFRFLRGMLEDRGGYSFTDSANRISCSHAGTRTRLRVIGSNARGAFGLVGCPWVIADEPGAWEVRGGELLFDAIETAKGKPGSPLRAVYIGTLAPAVSGWYHDLIAAGSGGSAFVMALQGDPKTWDSWQTIRKANPLSNISAELRARLLEERDKARADSRLKGRFLSYRLNVPTADASTMLLDVEDWTRACGREVPERDGRPIVGIDLGGGRAWSAAVALWRSGRVEAMATCPGIPGLAAQERRDQVPSGTYRMLADAGVLRIAEGLRVQPPAGLVRAVQSAWGRPEMIVCDRFRLAELQDAAGLIPLVSRISRWSESSFDIRALRRIATDGPLSVAPESRALLIASLSAAQVRPDDAGNVRMVKDGTNNTARDDVAAALVLACGAWERSLSRPGPPAFRYHGLAG